jgi:hypothetical protein
MAAEARSQFRMLISNLDDGIIEKNAKVRFEHEIAPNTEEESKEPSHILTGLEKPINKVILFTGTLIDSEMLQQDLRIVIQAQGDPIPCDVAIETIEPPEQVFLQA